jgi:hypothetical protein
MDDTLSRFSCLSMPRPRPERTCDGLSGMRDRAPTVGVFVSTRS